MIETRLYLYDSSKVDYKGTDYSQFILTGNSWTDDLTEVLDVAEMTLVGLSFSEEFDPTTKFIMELFDTETNMVVETLSLCVADDVVSQPILSDDHYFNHAITFNEASVIAQGRIVDNCSETFELKKVDINDESVYDPSKLADAIKKETSDSDYIASVVSDSGLLHYSQTITYKRKFKWVFTEEYLPNTDPNYGQASAWNNIQMYKPVSGSDTVTLPIPLLGTQFGAKGTSGYEDVVNLCSVTVEVYDSDDGVEWSLMGGYPLDVNPSKLISREYTWVCDWRFTERYGSNLEGYGMTKVRALAGNMWEYYKRFAEFDDATSSRFISFTVVPNKQYMVIVKPKFFATAQKELGTHNIYHGGFTNSIYGDSDSMYYTYSYAYSRVQTSFTLGATYQTNNVGPNEIILPTTSSNDGNPMLKLQFSTFVAGANTSTFLKSAPAISAYDLFTDTQLKSQTTEKQGSIYIKDTPLAYYCDTNDINKLQSTEIIESSFNQKNFWEILLEVGKYIHAIPYIEFGENDRFVVRWRYLGKTDMTNGVSTTMSIFNSRSIENYVGALNSYVDNMVQNGGQVEEYVSPKTESDDYLVYNDTAIIKTAKPIIEILSLKFRIINSNGIYYTAGSTEYDITNYIYEHNVYELLDVAATVVPNKGLAIYYNLGENVIRGLNYQLPSVNVGAGETEYAIKRIIGKLLMSGSPSNWKEIKINDFAFHITYRTKETVRTEQSRPDLRKYLINSSYEKIPHHKQFNNQQDKMVDSLKLGNQVYGKLIRTGNTEYQTTEWCNNAWELKKSGDLVNIRGNIYYVSKATHTFFQDHIVSEITYSKDYNQLSEIIGIPSEPRFFEISEQSSIDRQVPINDYLFLGTDYQYGKSYINNYDYIKGLLFGNMSYPKYALTQFKNDVNNPDPERGLDQFSKAFMHPLSSYSMRNTLTLKWEMADNFSAGDRVQDKNASKDTSTSQTTIDTAYASLIPSQYCDMYGRADLIDFAILKDVDSTIKTKQNIQNLPLCPYSFIQTSNASYSLGTNYTAITYQYSPYSPVQTLTPSTTSFVINNDYGDVFDENGNSILRVGVPRAEAGDYFVLNSDGLCCLYVCLRSFEPKFERVMVSNSVIDILNEISKPTIKELYEDDDDNLLITSGVDNSHFGTGEHGLALVKDNRERIIFDYNLQLLTDSDRFVLSGYLWQQNKGNVKLALLKNEVNKIVNNTIPENDIVRFVDVSIDLGHEIHIHIDDALYDEDEMEDIDLTDIKALAIVTEKKPSVGGGNERYFVMARNIDGLTDAQKRNDWYISTIESQYFFKKQ